MVSNNVTVVSAFVPLKVKHMTAERYLELGDQMFRAARKGGAEARLIKSAITDCWSYDLLRDLPPATETPSDRYDSPYEHVQSHIVQHTRTQWARQAAEHMPHTDVVVWLDLGLLKQGEHTGRKLNLEHVTRFVEAVAKYPFDDIPFPGITGPDPWLPHGNNWRFCGSTHIWPVKWLDQIHKSYQVNLRNFVHDYSCAPLDLAIWPLVERSSGLPFRWYQAEYDSTQLENFPCAP